MRRQIDGAIDAEDGLGINLASEVPSAANSSPPAWNAGLGLLRRSAQSDVEAVCRRLRLMLPRRRSERAIAGLGGAAGQR